MSSTTEKDPLLHSVRGFLEKWDMPASTFGREALNDLSFVSDLEAGREPRRATRQRVLEFMQNYRGEK